MRITGLRGAHPGVKVVSGDHSPSYALGIYEGAPGATQVADRFHLLMNVREAVEKVVKQHYLCGGAFVVNSGKGFIGRICSRPFLLLSRASALRNDLCFPPRQPHFQPLYPVARQRARVHSVDQRVRQPIFRGPRHPTHRILASPGQRADRQEPLHEARQAARG